MSSMQAIWEAQSALQKAVQQLCAAVAAGDVPAVQVGLAAVWQVGGVLRDQHASSAATGGPASFASS